MVGVLVENKACDWWGTDSDNAFVYLERFLFVNNYFQVTADRLNVDTVKIGSEGFVWRLVEFVTVVDFDEARLG